MLCRKSLIFTGLFVLFSTVRLCASWGIVTSDDQMVMLTAERQEKLKNASNYFKLAFSRNWQEGRDKIFTLDEVSASTFNDFERLLDMNQPEIVIEFLKTKTLSEIYELAQFIDHINYGQWNVQIIQVLADKMLSADALHGYCGKYFALSDPLRDQLKTFLPAHLILASDSCLQTLNGDISRIFCTRDELVADSKGNIARLWNVQTGELLKTFTGHEGTVNCIEILKDTLITGSSDGTVRVWDIHTGNCLQVLAGEGIFEIFHMAITADGTLITGCDVNKLQVWDMHTWQCLRTLTGHNEKLMQMMLASNDKLITISDDHAIRIWDIQKGICIKKLTQHKSCIARKALTSDGVLVTASVDHMVCFWDVQTGELLHVIVRCDSLINCITTTSDGRVIIGFVSGNALVINPRTGKTIRPLSNGCSISCMTLARDGRLFVGSFEGDWRVWDMQTYKCLQTIATQRISSGHTEFISSGLLAVVSGGDTVQIYGLPVPEINTLSVEQTLLVLKIVKKQITIAQTHNQCMKAYYAGLPESTRDVLSQYVPTICAALSVRA